MNINVEISEKHLVLDASVVIDFWLNEDPGRDTLKFIETAQSSGTHLWIAATIISTLESVAISRLQLQGTPAEQAKKIVFNQVQKLLEQVQVLSNFGFEQKEIYAIAKDFEDAQIAASARCLKGGLVAIVSMDPDFDALNELPVFSPKLAMAWIETEKNIRIENLNFIDLAAQQRHIRPALESGIEKVLRHGQYILGPEVKELETKLVDFTGAKHCITVASGTEALLIALMSLGIGPGDEVITTPFTFVATAEVIVLVGATPVFVDIEPDTCNINASFIEAAITPKTKAIMPVSLYGQPADMDEINDIARKYKLPVIEDAAQSFGAEYKGRKSCNLSTIGCTSFFPSKPLGCYGDGGAIFTNDETIALACREIRVHGQSKRYVHTRIGVGGRMDTLQCAVMIAKLSRLEHEIKQRIAAGNVYLEQLKEASIASLKLPVVRQDRNCVWGQFTVQISDRDFVLSKLNSLGIPTAVHYPVPLHNQLAYQNHCRISGSLENAELVATRVVSLPMHPFIDSRTQNAIVRAVSDSVVC